MHQILRNAIFYKFLPLLTRFSVTPIDNMPKENLLFSTIYARDSTAPFALLAPIPHAAPPPTLSTTLAPVLPAAPAPASALPAAAPPEPALPTTPATTQKSFMLQPQLVPTAVSHAHEH